MKRIHIPMSQKLDNILSTYSYDARQKNQLRLADEKGLDIDIIKDPRYDWEQMREIALAMEFGLDPAPLCNPNISSEAMENIRIHLFENQGVYENAKADIHLKRTRILTIIIVITLLLSSIAALLYAKKDYIMAYYEDIELTLTDDHITLSYGETFHPIDYVKEYDEKNTITLPKLQKMDQLTDYEYVYEVSNGVKTITKTLIVTVIDNQKPTINLKQQEVTLTQGDKFNPLDYVASVNDNYSKLKKEDITFEGNVDTSQQGKFTFRYILKDSSNNKTTATLNVTVKEAPKAVNQSSNNSTPTKPNNPSKPQQQQPTKPKPSNKVFYIRDYNYDIASCKNAAVSYMDSQLHSTSATYGELQPYQEGGTTVGYKVVFK